MGEFFYYLKSEEYESFWSSVVSHAETKPATFLYYFVTRYLLDEMIHQIYPVTSVADCSSEAITLSTDEEAALTYVIRPLLKKVEGRQLKEALKQFLEIDDDPDDDGDGETEPDWLSMCNRGGLFRVRTEFINLLHSMEIVLMKANVTSDSVRKEVTDQKMMTWWTKSYSISKNDYKIK